MSSLIIKLIKTYQYISRNLIQTNALSLFIIPQCRYYPSCSEYTIESVSKYGLFKGLIKGVGRIVKCNPLFRPLNQ